MDFLEGLNPQQRAAVAHVEGPLLLLAGAGSGKTRVITHRIAHLVDAHHVPGPCVLAVTFTNKAADEMRQRVNSLLPGNSSRSSPLVSTFHSFCVRLLRRDGEHLADIRPGFTRNFTIYDDDDQVSLLKSIYRELGLDEKFMPYRGASSWISHNKSQKVSPQDVYKSAKDPKMSRLAVIYDRYEQRLRLANSLDFDDLLLESVRVLHHDTELRAQLNRRFEFLMIDEYQDTNRSQYELMRLLTDSHKNLAVVGDEDQSIYGWRGADIRNILDFERDYPNSTVIRLEQNYRSTKNILEASSALVANNKDRKGKWLWTEAGAGERIGVYEALDGENEALFIADTMDKLLRDNPGSRAAVLYRTNFQSRQIEEALRRYNRKYIVVGGFSFYQRAEIKDVLAYMKVLLSPHDSISLLRIINTPARGIGKTTVEQIEQFALENQISLWNAIGRMLDEGVFAARSESSLRAFRDLLEQMMENVRKQNVDETLREILERTGYQKMLQSVETPESESKLGNLMELVNAATEATERGESPTEFLDHAALVADSDNLDEKAQVSLLTMHNAKGLEFPFVFIAGMEEGLFPHQRSIDSREAMEEERRLCYVGMTRAEKRLILSHAKFRRKFGGSPPERCIPSRFLKEIPKPLTQPLGKRETDLPDVDLFSEQHEVRETVKKNLYTGKTYNSLENISQFFAEKGMPPPQGLRLPQPPAPPPSAAPIAAAPVSQTRPAQQNPVVNRAPAAGYRPAGQAAQAKKGFRSGSIVRHPKYGRGTVLRREGDGEDAKITVSFPGYGLKKLVEKYAGIQEE
ncbi:MAG: UvrD-helicase domain-containing protein [Acidobacteriaceae bacterium]|nr:UvrD-helicase domain-containing protein [Acidobacteriaceae bacterium]